MNFTGYARTCLVVAILSTIAGSACALALGRGYSMVVTAGAAAGLAIAAAVLAAMALYFEWDLGRRMRR